MNVDKALGSIEWNDRRTHRRTPIADLIQLQHPAGPQLAEMIDLSSAGVGVIVDDPPANGTQVNVALDLGELGRLDALAVTVRNGPVVGLRFVGLSAKEYLRLSMFLSRHRPHSS
jgi:hypothetical protein